MTTNSFALTPDTDELAAGTYLAHKLTATVFIDGDPDEADAFAAALNGTGKAADPGPHGIYVKHLALARKKTIHGTPDARQRVFHIPLPHHDSLVEFASDLAGEFRRDWPNLSAVIIGTPHRHYASHQVSVISEGTHSYTEQYASHNDTLVIVANGECPLGILRDGAWHEADDDCDFYQAADVIDAYVSGGRGKTAYLAALGDDDPPLHAFAEAGIALNRWGRRLWAATY